MKRQAKGVVQREVKASVQETLKVLIREKVEERVRQALRGDSFAQKLAQLIERELEEALRDL